MRPVETLVDAWWSLLYWWPFPPIPTIALLAGMLLLAQALNLSWERRELLRLLSRAERRAGALLLLLWVAMMGLWATGDGFAWTSVLAGAYARWFVVQVIRLGDAGRLGQDSDEEDDADD